MSKVYILNPDGTISVSTKVSRETRGEGPVPIRIRVPSLPISEDEIGDEKLFNIIENDFMQSARDSLNSDSSAILNIDRSKKIPDEADIDLVMTPFSNDIDSSFGGVTSITKIKNNSLKNSSHDFVLPDNTTVLEGKSVETILNFNSTGGDRDIFASEFEMAGGIPSAGLLNPQETTKKITLGFKILIDAIIHILAAESIFALNNLASSNGGQNVEENFNLRFGENSNIDFTSLSSFIFKRLNYPRYKARSFKDADERISAFIIGFIEIISGDNLFDSQKFGNLDFDKRYQRDVSDRYGSAFDIGDRLGIGSIIGSTLFYFTDILLTLTSSSINRLLLLERKISHQKHWFNKLYDAKSVDLPGNAQKTGLTGLGDSIANAAKSIDHYMKTMDYYFFKFVIERMHVGLKLIKYYEHSKTTDSHVTYESSINRVGLSKSGKKTNSNIYSEKDNYLWRLEKSGTSLSQAIRVRALPQSLLMTKEMSSLFNSSISGTNNEISSNLLQNFSIKTGEKHEGPTNRLSRKLVKDVEEYLNSEYMPFYFHDLRTNEIISFHAFVDNISDSFSADYSPHSGFGRVDDIKTYTKTTRSISLSFTIASTSLEDHDLMWYQINKLVSMCYPQYSRGSVNTGLSGNDDLTYPYTQVPTNSPLIRLRVGDVIKSNYSRKNLARKFGFDSLYANKDLNYSEADGVFTWKAEAEAGNLFIDDNRSNKAGKNITSLGNDKNYLRQFDSNSNIKNKKSERGVITPYAIAPRQQLIIRNEYCYLMPGLYFTKSNNIFSALGSTLGLTSGGKEYVHIKEYEKINVEETRNLSSKLDEESEHKIEVVLENKKYKDITFTCDIFSITRKEAYDNPNRVGDFKFQMLSEQSIDGDKHAGKKIRDELGVRDFKIGVEESIRHNTDRLFTFRNPVLDAHESSKGEGLAGFITNLDINYNEQLWETSKKGSKAPHAIKVTISYSPIHDIPLGLDREGMMTAPAYNVGDLNKAIFSSVYSSDFEKEYAEYAARLEKAKALVSKESSTLAELMASGSGDREGIAVTDVTMKEKEAADITSADSVSYRDELDHDEYRVQHPGDFLDREGRPSGRLREPNTTLLNARSDAMLQSEQEGRPFDLSKRLTLAEQAEFAERMNQEPDFYDRGQFDGPSAMNLGPSSFDSESDRINKILRGE